MKKHIIFYELQKQFKSRPHIMKKLKVFALVGLFCFVLVGGLLIWAGVTAVQTLVRSAQAVNIPAVQIEPVQLKTADCWNKAQNLLTIQPWLEKPALVNLQDLKVACLEQKSQLKGEPNDSSQI